MKFFQHGEVSVLHVDPETGQLALDVRMPCLLLQAASPLMLAGGFMDDLRLVQPLMAWLPTLTADRYRPQVLQETPDVAIQVSTVLKERVMDMLNLYKDVSGLLINPDDAIMALPIGVYVHFRYRCTFDSLARVVIGLKTVQIAGMAEFVFAAASVLAEAVAGCPSRPALHLDDIPPMLGVAAASDSSDGASTLVAAHSEDLPSKNG